MLFYLHATVLSPFTQEKHTKSFHETVKRKMIVQHFGKMNQQVKISADLLKKQGGQPSSVGKTDSLTKSLKLPDKHFVEEVKSLSSLPK